jgi:SAM-dependent methyltransferase
MNGPILALSSLRRLHSMSDPNNLCENEFWKDQFWKIDDEPLPDIRLDDGNLEFREQEKVISKYLVADPNTRCLEIGCCPGRYLWYFHTKYQYQVFGIEYVEKAAARTQAALDQHSIPAKILCEDLFNYSVPVEDRFQVVCSVGFVEHYRDIQEPLQKHIDLLAPEGLLIIWVPNHRGICGWILRLIQPDFFAMHNRMSWKDLKGALSEFDDIEILEGGYWGKFNLAPSNFLPWLRSKVYYYPYRVVEKLHNLALRWGHYFPDTRVTSPYLGVVARRRKTEDKFGK